MFHFDYIIYVVFLTIDTKKTIFRLSMSGKFEQICQWSLNGTCMRKIILPRLTKSTDR